MKKIIILLIVISSFLSFDNLNSQAVTYHEAIWSMPHGIITPTCERNEVEVTLKFENKTGSSKEIEFPFYYNSSYARLKLIDGENSFTDTQRPGVLNGWQIKVRASINKSTAI